MAGTITHEWNGTVLTITSDSGTSSADLKGEKGDTGVRGAQGIAGNVEGVDLSNYYTKAEIDAIIASLSGGGATEKIRFTVEISNNSDIITYEVPSKTTWRTAIEENYIQNYKVCSIPEYDDEGNETYVDVVGHTSTYYDGWYVRVNDTNLWYVYADEEIEEIAYILM